jgi:hypothetical protein
VPSQEPGQRALPAVDRALGNVLEINSVGPADGLAVAIELNSAEEGEDGAEPSDPTFELIVLDNGSVVETFSNVTIKPGERHVATATAESKFVKVAVKADVPADLDALLAMPKAPSPVPRRTAVASTASSSPTTSPWCWCPIW